MRRDTIINMHVLSSVPTKKIISFINLAQIMASLIARFMGPTWAHLGPTWPRWAPCWPRESCCLACYPTVNNVRFKSPTAPTFVPQFIYPNIKDKIKASPYWSLSRETTVDRCIPGTRASTTESTFLWWCIHESPPPPFHRSRVLLLRLYWWLEGGIL